MIGVIADDFTGATDVAVAFRRTGLITLLLFGHPTALVDVAGVDVVVVALKTRTIAPSSAVEQSMAAAAWLLGQGATQFYFKICSTFDSTPDGNIGPVAEALAEYLDASPVIVVPSSPEHGRTQYDGYLFVTGQLLSESPMRNHPLTPMMDSSIPRLLAPQTRGAIGLISHDVVTAGAAAVAAALGEFREPRVLVVVDAINAADLATIGEAAAEHPLIVGAAGLAGGFGAAIARRLGRTGAADSAAGMGVRSDFLPAAVLAGSCSARTLEQVEEMKTTNPSFFIDPISVATSEEIATTALAWYDTLPPSTTPLIYSSTEPDRLRAVQDALGIERASELLEGAMGRIARGLVERGVRRIVVAGGETSGAVVSALGIVGGKVGGEPAVGVPWIYTVGTEPLALLLKSGNFGSRDLLRSASQERLD